MTVIEYHCGLNGDSIRMRPLQGHSGINITFKRTVRVADNNRANYLPPFLGNFPLYKVKDYTKKLPAAMAAKGGVFLPMYRKSLRSEH